MVPGLSAPYELSSSSYLHRMLAAPAPILGCFTFPREHMGSTNTLPSSASTAKPKISHSNADLEGYKSFICSSSFYFRGSSYLGIHRKLCTTSG